MARPLVSVVLATFNREHLLRRSLECYARSEGIDVQRDLELIVIDDHSDDDTWVTVTDFCHTRRISYQIITPGPKLEAWRDCGATLNCGIRASSGRHILLTHPEVMCGRRSIAALTERLEAQERSLSLNIGLYAACKVYYLSPRSQELIDTVPWREKGVLALRDIPDFYAPTIGNQDYHPHVTDLVARPGYRIQTWDSFVFAGMSRETWKRFGGLTPTQRWGSVDIAWHHRRKKLGMAEWTAPDDDTICGHQNHDLPGNVPTDRNEAAWREECLALDLNNKLRYPEVDELW